jgi:2-oxoglutarate dehydrogenase E1 component
MSELFFLSQEYLERAFEEYLKDPDSVPKDQALFFKGVEFAYRGMTTAPHFSKEVTDLFFKVYRLVDHYKRCGHYRATTNPLSQLPLIPVELTLKEHNIEAKDLEKEVPTFQILAQPTAPLSFLLEVLKSRYTGNVGFEYMHLQDAPLVIREIDRYLLEEYQSQIDEKELKEIYKDLKRAENFESFLHKRHMGKKRFSLEGAESLIPMLECLVKKGKSSGLTDLIIGMAHRGRLNVLAHVLKKEISQIFYEFESDYTPMYSGSGDVKYHMGFTKKREGIEVTLAPNPSHLESVDPVILGMCRAKCDLANKPTALAITIHGDAALAGQGVVYESLQAMRLEGYKVGGGIHIVINNQIGFTATPEESRSTVYCTDIAKAFNCPIFHVNAMDPLSCVRITKLALHIARTFHIDVFIDLLGYRKYGHNEGDEPGFTQPLMVEKIKKMPEVSSLVAVDETFKKQTQETIESELEHMFQLAKEFARQKKEIPQKPVQSIPFLSSKIGLKQAQDILKKIAKIPADFQIHPRLKKIIEERGVKEKMDWAMAEAVAFGSLLEEGISVRLSGEDSRRGTFSHRHSTLVDQKEGNLFIPLNNLSINQAPFTVINSYLSEYAVMGFEYGYSLVHPNSLVIWEGQFGDFVNGAQIIIDQYLVSAETKWGVTSGLVLYLPHGFEGQGPEHSSARIERFLEVAAEKNMVCAIPTTTAQLFHLLRRQGISHPKRPLILFTPKSLLRDEISFSPVEEVHTHEFYPILKKSTENKKSSVCIFTFGKIAYDIQKKAESLQRDDYLLFCIEQLYPFDEDYLKNQLENLGEVTRFVFVQDEPKNMGAYPHLRPKIEALLNGQELSYIGRKEASSPASGSPKISLMELEHILKEIFHE